MASRCRSCHLSLPRASEIRLPPPEALIPLAPHLGVLVDAAAEFESFGDGSPLEFLRWFEFEVRRAAGLSVTVGRA